MKKLALLLFLAFFFLSLKPSAFAQEDICINTAIGKICGLDNPANFVSWLITFATGIAGGIAFLLIVVGAIQVLVSSGNPEKIQAGKELITSALAGLLLIIFAVFILRLIGAEILKIPGFE